MRHLLSTAVLLLAFTFAQQTRADVGSVPLGVATNLAAQDKTVLMVSDAEGAQTLSAYGGNKGPKRLFWSGWKDQKQTLSWI